MLSACVLMQTQSTKFPTFAPDCQSGRHSSRGLIRVQESSCGRARGPGVARRNRTSCGDLRKNAATERLQTMAGQTDTHIRQAAVRRTITQMTFFPPTSVPVCFIAACAIGFLVSAPASAQTEENYRGKMTFGVYAAGSQPTVDVNARYSAGDWTGWLGWYGPHSEIGSQARAGLEYDMRRRRMLIIPSVQVASASFVGSSLYSEIGGTVYAIAGVSRTNLEPYVNLNFDPNESWQIGAGAFPAGHQRGRVHGVGQPSAYQAAEHARHRPPLHCRHTPDHARCLVQVGTGRLGRLRARNGDRDRNGLASLVRESCPRRARQLQRGDDVALRRRHAVLVGPHHHPCTPALQHEPDRGYLEPSTTRADCPPYARICCCFRCPAILFGDQSRTRIWTQG